MLRVEEISVRFGGVHTLDQLTLGVGAGTITGLIGPTAPEDDTLQRHQRTAAAEPRPCPARRPGHHQAVAGTARAARPGANLPAPRGLRFDDGEREHPGRSRAAPPLGARRPEPRAATAEILERLGISPVADVQADTLPTGIAWLVELGRAIATEPSVLLLDEPGSGLDTAETHALGDVLLSLTASGIGVLLVEHDMELAMRVSNELYVLEFGRVIATGRPADIQADPAVRLAYLGAEAHVEGRRATALDAAVPDDMLPEDDVAQVIARGNDEHTDVPRIVVNATARGDDGESADPTASPPGRTARRPILEPAGIKAGIRRDRGPARRRHRRLAGHRVRSARGQRGREVDDVEGGVGPTPSLSGHVRFAGQDVTRWHPERLTRRGSARFPRDVVSSEPHRRREPPDVDVPRRSPTPGNRGTAYASFPDPVVSAAAGWPDAAAVTADARDVARACDGAEAVAARPEPRMGPRR